MLTVSPMLPSVEGTGNVFYRVWKDSIHVGTFILKDGRFSFKGSEWSSQHYGWLLDTTDLLQIAAHSIKLNKALIAEEETI